MNDPAFVRGVERFSDLTGKAEHSTQRKSAPGSGRDQQIRNRSAVDELQHERARVWCLFDPVNGGNAGMVERRQHTGLAVEASQALGVAGERRRQDFDRHIAMQSRVSGPVDFAHAAPAQRLHDAIRADVSAGGQRHAVDYTRRRRELPGPT